MSTIYTYETTITVRVTMADEGDVSEIDGKPTHWDSPAAQEESAREWADQAMPLSPDYAEEWVEIDVPPLTLIAAAKGGE